MTIEIIDGCLLDAFDRGDIDVIGHVVNCQGVMGSGIAYLIRQRYPNVFKDYKDICEYAQPTANLLGNAQWVSVGGNEYSTRGVVNLFSQDFYGTSKRHLNYGALSKSLSEMSKSFWASKVGFPYKMGSDRAGGDWDIVLEMIEYYFKDHQVKIYRLSK